jgi:hypothetical protein
MDALPLKPFLDLLTLGLVQPRKATRLLLNARPNLAERFTMVGLAAAMQALMTSFAALLAPDLVGATSAGVGFVGHLALAAAVLIGYVVTATLAYNIGVRFGGKGAPADVATGVALHAVLVAALTPLQIAAIGAGAAPMLLLYLGLNIWLLASCVAEAHGFEKTGPVAAVTVGVFFLIALVISVVLVASAAGCDDQGA